MTTPKAAPRNPVAAQSSDVVNSWLETSRAAIAPAQELTDITKRAFEKANAQNLAVAKQYVEFGVRSLQMLGSVRDPRALVEQQVALAKEAGEQFLANADAYVKLTAETQAPFNAWAEKATESATAKLEAVVSKAA